MANNSIVEDVLQHADIVNIISSYIDVKRSGRNFVAICPFHDDKHPSMQISKDKQIFKCFACQTGGNAIGFVQQYEKIPFGAAMRKVADLSGFSDPRLLADTPRIQVDESTSRLYQCIDDLHAYYKYALTIPEGEEARNYLNSRDLGPEICQKYGIGYAPIDGVTTVKFLRAKGHSLKAIDDIGVALSKGDSTNDHNAGRVIFPLFNPNGQVVGFSARRIKDDDTAKYINSPEGPIFHKGSLLYNYHNIVISARRACYCYLVEGFMDVMALDRAGEENAVALMGTSLTNEQINLLRRLKCEIRLCLDGDDPGQSAMMKAAVALSKGDVRCRLVDYEGDKRDPDEILRGDGADALKRRISTLIEPIDFQLTFFARTKKLSSKEDKTKALNSFLPYLCSRPLGIELEDALVKVAQATGYSVEAIRTMVEKTRLERAQTKDAIDEVEQYFTASPATLKRNLSRLETAEDRLVHYMFDHPEAREAYLEEIQRFEGDSVYGYLAEFVIEYAATHNQQVDLKQLMVLIESSGLKDAQEISMKVAEMAMQEDIPPFTKERLEECLQVITEETDLLKAKEAAKKQIDSGDVDVGAQANAELAKRLKDKMWKKRKRKEDDDS